MERDGHIRLLPLHIANKIAAGEVVERPASVVKELVENALDAGAARIDVSVTAGGRNLISVRDDGCGMSREDALLSLERQATSKIRDVDDILKIDTLGFRGEAIPSIAAVSRFTMTTRRAGEESAWRLQVNAGVLAEVREAGAPPGTSVEVRDLFCNVPARRKFLRSYATEEAAVRHVFTVHALAHPDVGFSLSCDGREVSRLPKGDSLEDRIRVLFGGDLAPALVPLEGEAGDVSVRGFAERAEHAAATRREQFVFVNGRPATAPVVSAALRDAYPRSDSKSRPAVFMFIGLPPSQVDVNVHPAKREVRFRKPGDVRAAILSALSAFDPLPARPAPPPACAPPPPAAPAPAPAASAPACGAPPPFAVPFATGPSREKTAACAPASVPSPSPQPPPPAQPSPPPPPPPPQQAVPAPKAVFLAQMRSGYLLFETESGLVAVSPRPARERILYERLANRRDGAALSQPLLVPLTVQMPPAAFARIRANIDAVESLGFRLEEFGASVWKVEAVPLAGENAAAEILAAIADDLAEGSARRGGERWKEETAARACARACAGRLPGFDKASAEKLMAELQACRMPYASPGGAPTMILVTNRDFERRFAR